ncbi:MAG: pilus assembly protein TadG-related protein [Bacillota bacterium]
MADAIKDKKGLSFFMVCIGITAIFGMTALVTDFGRIALARQRLANAADSAAMAAARDMVLEPDPNLREDIARQRAVDVLAANVSGPHEINVSLDGNKVSVDARQTVRLIMSRVFGVMERPVSAHAAAEASAVTSYTGVAPLTIKEQPLEYGQMVTLKFGSPDSPGNFGALALNGRGSLNYKYNLINGFSQEIKVGDVLETEPGNMNGPTDGIEQRLDRCTDGCTYNNFRPGCPKVIVIPLHRDELQGRDEITVTGFAAFFIDRESTLCADDEIKGYFVKMAAEGNTDLLKPITSLYGVRLVE